MENWSNLPLQIHIMEITLFCSHDFIHERKRENNGFIYKVLQIAFTKYFSSGRDFFSNFHIVKQ